MIEMKICSANENKIDYYDNGNLIFCQSNNAEYYDKITLRKDRHD